MYIDIYLITMELEEEWQTFLEGNEIDTVVDALPVLSIPKCPEASPLKISTKVNILFLTIKDINIKELYWKLPTIRFWEQKEGIIKKQMKYTCFSKDEYNSLLEKKKVNPYLIIDTIKHYERELEEQETEKKKKSVTTIKPIDFKNISKLTIGISHKDISNRRIKKKGAFYNCFMLVLRINKDRDNYREISVKIFNTGKLSFPGMLTDKEIEHSLNIIINILEELTKTEISYQKDTLETVLINSNFNCGFYLNRDKLYHILKYKYKIHATYDQCSYPGIQCKFFDNIINTDRNGYCICKKSCNRKGDGLKEGNCREISFMIFRTGSVLIVGKGEEELLIYIYNFIKQVIRDNYNDIFVSVHEIVNNKDVIKETKSKLKYFYKSK
jgi:TATA-box binding protein (TBP) (component of TFIID and TFIIIB)